MVGDRVSLGVLLLWGNAGISWLVSKFAACLKFLFISIFPRKVFKFLRLKFHFFRL